MALPTKGPAAPAKRPKPAAKKPAASGTKKPPKTQAQKEANTWLITYQKEYISQLQKELKEAQQRLTELKTR